MMRIDKKKESGFTLVEIMIALAIFSMVIVGVIEVFGNSNKSYMMQDDISNMQQNIRIAKMFIERDIRMADASFIFANGAGDGGSDKLTVGSIKYAENACGDDPDDTDSITTPCDRLSTLNLRGSMPENSAIARVYQDLSKEAADWRDGCYCGGETYDPPQYGFQAEIISPDGSTSDTFYLTGVNDNKNNQLQNSPIRIDGVRIDNKILNAYPDRSTIRFFIPESRETTMYWIKDHELIRTDLETGEDQVIADNAEDLQFAFCGDFDGDGIVDPENDDDWFSTDDLEAGDLPEADKQSVRYVRVTLLGRTTKEHGLSNTRPTIEDHEQADNKDMFNRCLLQSTVQLRNAAF